MAKTKEATGDTAAAELELHAADEREFGAEDVKIDEETAAKQAEIIAEVAGKPDMPHGDRAQDHLAYELARSDEARAKGVEQTTEEALWQIARQEEAEAQGVEGIENTTQKTMFRESRKEEVRAEKWEEAAHGPATPREIGVEGEAPVEGETFEEEVVST